jgi:carbon catabolite-derepressing protein kinase
MYDMEDDSSAMEDFMASSPPAWNVEMPPPSTQQPQNGYEELDIDEVDGDIQDIPNSHFDVLDSSLPGYLTREHHSAEPH